MGYTSIGLKAVHKVMRFIGIIILIPIFVLASPVLLALTPFLFIQHGIRYIKSPSVISTIFGVFLFLAGLGVLFLALSNLGARFLIMITPGLFLKAGFKCIRSKFILLKILGGFFIFCGFIFLMGVLKLLF